MFKLLIPIIIFIFSYVHGSHSLADPRHEFIRTVRKQFVSEITERQKLLGTRFNSVALIDIARERLEMGITPASEPDWANVIHAVSLGWGYHNGVVNVAITETERNSMRRGYSFINLKPAIKGEAYLVEPSHVFSREKREVIEEHAYNLNMITRDICLKNNDIPKLVPIIDRAKKIISQLTCPLTPAQSAVMASTRQRKIDEALAHVTANMRYMLQQRARAEMANDPQFFRLTPHGIMRPTFAPLAAPSMPSTTGFSFRMTSVMDMPGFGGYSSSPTVSAGGAGAGAGAGSGASAPTFRPTGASAARDMYRSICNGYMPMQAVTMEKVLFGVGLLGAGGAAIKLGKDGAKAATGAPDPEDEEERKRIEAKGTPCATGVIRSFVTDKTETYYRVYSDKSIGGFLTKVPPASRALAREGLALPANNTAIYIQEVIVPAGTRLQRSRVMPVDKSVYKLRGGMEQFELLSKIPDANFLKGVPLS